MTVRQAACTFLHVDSLAFLPLSTKVHVRTQDRSGGRHQPQQAMTLAMQHRRAACSIDAITARSGAGDESVSCSGLPTHQQYNATNTIQLNSLCKEQTTGTTPSPRPHQRTPNRIECCAKGGVYRLWSSLALRLPRHWPLCPLSPHNRLHHRWTPSSLNNMRHRRRCIWGGPSRGEGSRTLHPAP